MREEVVCWGGSWSGAAAQRRQNTDQPASGARWEMTDEHISAQGGEGAAIRASVTIAFPTDEAIYAENITPVYAFIYSKIGHKETAQDLTADVFVKALALVDHTQSRASIRSWLFHIARTTIADYWRATLRTRVIPLDEMRERLRAPDETEADEEIPEPETLVTRAMAVLDRLPANYRAVLNLRFLRGYSLRETATALGISEGNVKVVQHRAIRKARDLAGEEVGYGRR